jgi:putative ABC transport system permease protein
MAAVLYWWRSIRRRTWRRTLVVILLCGILGAVALGALAGARRTESAYGRYLRSINSSDVLVNIPVPGTSVIAKVSALPGVRSSAAWLGLNANPVVHGRVDDAFLTDSLSGTYHGAFFTQDTMTVLHGRLPRLDATDEIALTPGLAGLFGVGLGGTVTYQFLNGADQFPVSTGYSSYRVVGIVEIPPALVDQFDQTQAAVLPAAATVAAEAQHQNVVEFSWVGMRLVKGSAGIPPLQSSLSRVAAKLGGPGSSFDIRRLDTVHQQVQDAIEPQAVALAVFGALVALAMLVLVGQGLHQLLDGSAAQLELLGALGMTRAEVALAGGLEGAVAVVVGVALAVAGAVAFSPLVPVGPVRQFDPARGVEFDVTVLIGGGLLLLLLLLGLVALLAWRSVRPSQRVNDDRPSTVARAAAALGVPTVAALGARYALEPPPGRRRGVVRGNLIGSVVAVTAVVTAVVFGTSLSGLVSHPVRYGWNWNVLLQAQGGYGNYSGYDLGKLMGAQPGVEGWSTFAFTQLPIDGQSVPVLGLATRKGSVEPPTFVGSPLDGPDQIELGENSLRQLDKQIGDTVLVGSGPTKRRMTIVGTVTLPSIGLMLTDHVSLGRGAMLPEGTLLAIEHLSSHQQPEDSALSALGAGLRHAACGPRVDAPFSRPNPGVRVGVGPATFSSSNRPREARSSSAVESASWAC